MQLKSIKIHKINSKIPVVWKFLSGTGKNRRIYAVHEDGTEASYLFEGFSFLLNDTPSPRISMIEAEFSDRLGNIWALKRNIETLDTKKNKENSNFDMFIAADPQNPILHGFSTKFYGEQSDQTFAEMDSGTTERDPTKEKIESNLNLLRKKIPNELTRLSSEKLQVVVQEIVSRINLTEELDEINQRIASLRANISSSTNESEKSAIIEQVTMLLRTYGESQGNQAGIKEKVRSLEEHLQSALSVFGLVEWKEEHINWDRLLKVLSQVYAWTEITQQSKINDNHSIATIRPHYIKANTVSLQIKNISEKYASTPHRKECKTNQFEETKDWFSNFKEETVKKSPESSVKKKSDEIEKLVQINDLVDESLAALDELGKKIEGSKGFTQKAVEHLKNLRAEFINAKGPLKLSENLSVSQLIKLIQLYGQIPQISTKLDGFKKDALHNEKTLKQLREAIERWRFINKNISFIELNSSTTCISEARKILNYEKETRRKTKLIETQKIEASYLEERKRTIEAKLETLNQEVIREGKVSTIEQCFNGIQYQALTKMAGKNKGEKIPFFGSESQDLLHCWFIDNQPTIPEDTKSHNINIVITKSAKMFRNLLDQRIGRVHFAGLDTQVTQESSEQLQAPKGKDPRVRTANPAKIAEKPIEIQLQDKVARTLAILNGRTS